MADSAQQTTTSAIVPDRNGSEELETRRQAPTPLALILLMACVVVLFQVTGQNIVATIIAVLAAPVFQRCIDWALAGVEARIRAAIDRRIARLKPLLWVQQHYAPIAWSTLLLFLVGSLLYSPAARALSSGRDWFCIDAAVPGDFGCDTGIGVDSASYQGVYVGLMDPMHVSTFEQDPTLNAAEKSADRVIADNNRSACAERRSHTTLAVVTMLSRTVKDPSTSADFVGIGSLRGAALAQAGYNTDQPPTAICLTVANLGDSVTAPSALPGVMRRLALYAKHDTTFGGIVGMPFSSQAKSALEAGFPGRRSVPIVSPTASGIGLSSRGDFHRIVPPDTVQADAMAAFLSGHQMLGSGTTVGILVDDTDPYVSSLAGAMQRALTRAGQSPQNLRVYHYQLHNGTELKSTVMSTLKDGVSYVYFAGYAYDLNVIEDAIELYEQSTAHPRAPPTILGGDGICDLERYVLNPYVPVICTGYAGPLDTAAPHVTPCGGDFATRYQKLFDHNLPTEGRWTFYQPDAILWYDAVCAFGQAIADGGSDGTGDVPAVLTERLRTVSFNGLSGATTFMENVQASSDPGAKDVYIQCADRQRGLHVLGTGNGVVSTSYEPVSSCAIGG